MNTLFSSKMNKLAPIMIEIVIEPLLFSYRLTTVFDSIGVHDKMEAGKGNDNF
jgi:hypothetical protein